GGMDPAVGTIRKGLAHTAVLQAGGQFWFSREQGCIFGTGFIYSPEYSGEAPQQPSKNGGHAVWAGGSAAPPPSGRIFGNVGKRVPFPAAQLSSSATGSVPLGVLSPVFLPCSFARLWLGWNVCRDRSCPVSPVERVTYLVWVVLATV